MRLDIDLDRTEVVPVGAERRGARLGDLSGVGEGSGVELAAAQRSGERRRSRKKHLRTLVRRRLPIELDHGRQDDLLPER